MHYIGLLDCNNFFVSCERLFRPDLARTPVVVLSSNDGCIVARSQEVKDRGIPMGVPYFQVKDTLQEMRAVVFSSHFTLYRDISRRVFNVLQKEVDRLEQYSIDEAFFTYRGSDPEGHATVLKRQIERAVGIPVSIGLAASKTQAKWASAHAKRASGVCTTTIEDFCRSMSTVPLRDIWGVGVGRARAFSAAELHTVGDLLAADRDRVAAAFGVAGVRLRQELQGEPVYPVCAARAPQQSVMSSRSFAKSTTEYAVVADAVAYHLRHAAADIRAQRQVAGVVQVSVRPSRHGAYALRGGSASATLMQPTSDTFALLRVANDLLAEIWQDDVSYQKAGVTLSALQSDQYTQHGLWDDTGAGAETHALSDTLDRINSRYGAETLRVGSALASAHWQSKRDSLSPSYTTRWSDIPAVLSA